MRPAPFAEVLRAKLTGAADTQAAGQNWRARPATGPLFVAWSAPVTAGVAAARKGRAAYAARPVARTTPVPPPPALGPEARRAFLALNELGAGLDAGLNAADVRRAFRRLAQRYHPDRHPGSDAAERQRLARVFGEMTALSRSLTAALESAA